MCELERHSDEEWQTNDYWSCKVQRAELEQRAIGVESGVEKSWDVHDWRSAHESWVAQREASGNACKTRLARVTLLHQSLLVRESGCGYHLPGSKGS